MTQLSDVAFEAWWSEWIKWQPMQPTEAKDVFKEHWEAGFTEGMSQGKASRTKAAELWCMTWKPCGREHQAQMYFASESEARAYARDLTIRDATVLSVESTTKHTEGE